MSNFEVKVKVFEGPLNLLLFLIKKHKLNIFDIEISVLLEQYLNYINDMSTQNLDLSSEFLEIAAQLIYIKTASLLPKEKEESERLKEELTGRLLELEAIQSAAVYFSKNNILNQTYSRNPIIIKRDTSYTLKHSIEDIIHVYRLLDMKAKRKQPPPKEAFSGIVETKIISVTSRVIFVLRKLYKDGTARIEEFLNHPKKSYNVAAFLAILELIKAKRISLSKNNDYLTFRR